MAILAIQRVLDYTAIKTHVRITGAHGGGGGVVYKWGGGRGDSIDSIPMSSDLLCCPDRTSNLTWLTVSVTLNEYISSKRKTYLEQKRIWLEKSIKMWSQNKRYIVLLSIFDDHWSSFTVAMTMMMAINGGEEKWWSGLSSIQTNWLQWVQVVSGSKYIHGHLSTFCSNGLNHPTLAIPLMVLVFSLRKTKTEKQVY